MSTDKVANNLNLKDMTRKMRRNIISMLKESGSGHPGGSLSAADVLTVLYFDEMNIDEKNPQWADRDRFVLSKGHAAPALYAALALRGFFPVEKLKTLRKINSTLQGHPDMRQTPGVDFSTGSLGQGLSAACGMALAAKIDQKDYRVYAMIGDGENQEGQIWEAAMFAKHYKLDNLTVFLDHNHLQIDGKTEDVMSPEPLVDKWRAFGFQVLEINGHNITEIKAALNMARHHKGRPTLIMSECVKGKGVSFMENIASWHGVAPDGDQAAKAVEEIMEVKNNE